MEIILDELHPENRGKPKDFFCCSKVPDQTLSPRFSYLARTIQRQMRKLEDWLSEYGESHQHPGNKTIHWICVPSIVFSLVLILWGVVTPSAFDSIALNWAYLVMAMALVYYMFLSPTLSLGMVVVFLFFAKLAAFISETSTYPLWQIGLVIFVLAWIGQFYGHKLEGKKPSFLKDVQFLLIGPLWLLNFIYKRFNIKA